MPPLEPALRPSRDHDLQRMAKRGRGVPSQDLNPEAQHPLSEAERLRELQSSFSGGGLFAGMALAAPIGMLIAGPLGVMVGCTMGAIGGALAGIALSQSVLSKPQPLGRAQVLPLAD